MTGRPWLDGWVDAVGADPENAHIGRWSTFVVRLEDGGGSALVLRYERGTVVVDPGGTAQPDLVLRGPRGAWRELVDASAAPRRHDLLSLTKAPDGLEVVAGRDSLLRHLRVLTRLVELGRAHGRG
jgi:hypothetical protein